MATLVLLSSALCVVAVVLDAITPVKVPSTLATRVPTAYPLSLTSTVVVGSVVNPVNILNLSSLASLKNPLYFTFVDMAYLPNKPISNVLASLSFASFISGSSTAKSVTFKYVKVPLTVKLPETSKFAPTFTLPYT